MLSRLRRMAGFESQNFDPVVSMDMFAGKAVPGYATPSMPSSSPPALQENDVEREFQIHRTEGDYATAETWRWILASLIGFTMGVLGFVVDWGIGVLNNFKYFNSIDVIVTTRAPLAFTIPCASACGAPSFRSRALAAIPHPSAHSKHTSCASLRPLSPSIPHSCTEPPSCLFDESVLTVHATLLTYGRAMALA